MKLTRREYIKSNAIAAAAAAAGINLPATKALAGSQDDGEIRWDKAPCRVCGTGCIILV